MQSDLSLSKKSSKSWAFSAFYVKMHSGKKHLLPIVQNYFYPKLSPQYQQYFCRYWFYSLPCISHITFTRLVISPASSGM